MRVGVHLRHWDRTPHDVAALAKLAEDVGLESVWVSETWGSDATVLAGWIAAHTSRIAIGTGIVQMPARTPAATAMAAATIDHLSQGRFRLGLGVSGPRVAEGWHGVPFGSPLARTREYVAIVRAALARTEPLALEGEVYAVPVPGGEGRALKMNVLPLRTDLPIYLASMGPKNVALTKEIADGWLPLLFSPDHADLFELGGLREGFDVAPMVLTAIDDDLAAARDVVRPDIALYVGAYGPKKRNFYADLVRRYGFDAEVDAIQGAALEGRMGDATAAVTDAMVDTLTLAGPAAAVRDRLHAYAEAGATSVLAMTKDADTIRSLGRSLGRSLREEAT
jgi:F420-dependent oxidoreductase-like protein